MDRDPQVRGRRLEVVVVAQPEHVRAIPADRPDPARDLVELVEIEREIIDVMLELVDERSRPAMPDLALEQVGSHAARSPTAVDTSAAASKPDRQPSSWKP